MEAGFDSDIGGDVPDWDNTESRESDEDAAWRDLVARFDAPTITTEPAPWPERENIPPPSTRETGGVQGTEEARETDEADSGHGVHGARDLPGTGGDVSTQEGGFANAPDADPAGRGADTLGADAAGRGAAADGAAADGAGADARGADPQGADARGADARGAGEADDGTDGRGDGGGTRESRRTEGIAGPRGMRGFDDEGIRGALDHDAQPGEHQPDVIQAARRRRRTAARSIRARQAPVRASQADDGEHYVPPPPPPLPKLDSVAKGAWAALFGGPGYLVVATAAGWSVPGIAAFCAVAAFVTGFAILVLRMNDPGPGGPEDGDDGAVV